MCLALKRLGTVKDQEGWNHEAGFYIVFSSGLTRNFAAVAR